MKSHFGLLLFGVTSVIESIINLFLYVTFLYKFMPVCDFSFPIHFWYCDRVLKSGYLNKIKHNGQDL